MVCRKFSQEVGVMIKTVDKFSLMIGLNYLGSNLGLWPGLGICQLIEAALEFVAAKLRRMN